MGKSISRVLYLVIIYLWPFITSGSCVLPFETGNEQLPFLLPFELAPNGVYTATLSPRYRWALTSPFQPYHSIICFGGMFLLHFPYSYLRQPLAGILALWSPDFPHVATRLPDLPTINLYYTLIFYFCH